MIINRLFRFFVKRLAGYGLGKFSLIANIYFRVAKKAMPKYILFKDNKIFLESENSIYFATVGYGSEEYELSLFESEILASSVVLDIGASIGLYTLTAAKYAYKVYSFEPDPLTFANLKKNVEGNFYRNIITINKAVSDRNGESQFFSSSTKKSRASNYLIKDNDNTHDESIKVELVALDNFFKDKNEKIDIIKMDIEGAEFEAVRGMRNLIRANKDLKLFLEFNPHALIRQGTDLSSFLDYLYNLEFSFHHIDEYNRTKKAVSKEWLLSFAKNKKEGHLINLLAIRNTI
jgi:FkbM family methyltransferase